MNDFAIKVIKFISLINVDANSILEKRNFFLEKY